MTHTHTHSIYKGFQCEHGNIVLISLIVVLIAIYVFVTQTFRVISEIGVHIIFTYLFFSLYHMHIKIRLHLLLDWHGQLMQPVFLPTKDFAVSGSWMVSATSPCYVTFCTWLFCWAPPADPSCHTTTIHKQFSQRGSSHIHINNHIHITPMWQQLVLCFSSFGAPRSQHEHCVNGGMRSIYIATSLGRIQPLRNHFSTF